jgi:hypothetical protein
VACGNIPIIGKVFDEFDICKSPGLGKAIHAGAVRISARRRLFLMRRKLAFGADDEILHGSLLMLHC